MGIVSPAVVTAVLAVCSAGLSTIWAERSQVDAATVAGLDVLIAWADAGSLPAPSARPPAGLSDREPTFR